MEKLFILSPCGTSLLTNHARDVDERRLVGKYANTKTIEQLPREDGEKLQALVNRVQVKLRQADTDLVSRMSAELNGITKFYGHQSGSAQDYHLLLCTDTWVGETTANLAAQWLRNKGLTVEIKRQRDLQTKDILLFQHALSEIVRWCEEIIPGYRKSNYYIVFNLTGGFKSVQGFLQTLAAFYADESIYIFETSQDLLRIPRLPIEMKQEDVIGNNLVTFQRLSMDLPVSDTSKIPETLFLEIDGNTAFSPWGDIVWQQTKGKIYSQRLHPSPSEKLILSKKFKQSTQGLPADRLAIINERLDQLSRCLETNGEYNPRSLDFKRLQGDPCPPWTHEIDAWSEKDAKRIFGHYEEGFFILDKLDKGLH